MYGITSVYFAGVMVRLMLVLAPVACVLSAVAISSTLQTYMQYLNRPKGTKGKSIPTYPLQNEVSLVMVSGITLLLIFYAWHCTWVTSEAYSSPSIVLAARQQDGTLQIGLKMAFRPN